ncbi:hypothetical protein [Microbacterium sp. B24]|uniref:hypothetical protein n=1 Tax=Microbacterium sp. B24 TaxID=95616 RepID=UPI00041413B9|nr:hypothetical protein [Microbacterium sp. B24]
MREPYPARSPRWGWRAAWSCSSATGCNWPEPSLYGVVAAIAAVPVFAFEIWFAVWLITVGVRPDPGIHTAHAADAVVG